MNVSDEDYTDARDEFDDEDDGVYDNLIDFVTLQDWRNFIYISFNHLSQWHRQNLDR